jgi:hypothetical protein
MIALPLEVAPIIADNLQTGKSVLLCNAMNPAKLQGDAARNFQRCFALQLGSAVWTP